MKKTLSILLTVILTFSSIIFAFPASAASSLGGFYVVAFAEREETKIAPWFNNLDGLYYIFLPSGADRGNLKVNFDTSKSVTLGGKKIENGQMVAAFKKLNTATLKIGSSIYTLKLVQSGEIPSMYIHTSSGNLDYIHANKSNKESGSVSVIDDGEVALDEMKLKHIKGRGNSSWVWDKKSYNIKFDKKVDLLGMGKAKKWALISNYIDHTLMRNDLMFEIADRIGLDYTSKFRHVDLYINDKYMGNYLLCENVEVGSSRVNIEDLDDANEKANKDIYDDIDESFYRSTGGGYDAGSIKYVDLPNDPKDISGGYLLELEFSFRYGDEVSGFVTNKGQPVNINSPEYATKSEVEYISSFWQEAEDALYSSTGYNALGKHYSEYFDCTSLIKTYIIQEYTMNFDAGLSSCFFYKNANDDKLYSGPVWDFDRTLANHEQGSKDRHGISFLNPSNWWVNAMGESSVSNDEFGGVLDSIYAAAFRHEDFRDNVAAIWQEVANNFGSGAAEIIDQYENMLEKSAAMEMIRWASHKLSSSATKQCTYSSEVEAMKQFALKRKKALDIGFGTNAAMLYYDANGGKGSLYNDQIAKIGQSVTLRGPTDDSPIEPPEGFTFAGWNSEADGSGKSYKPGQIFKLNGRTTVLFAQWKVEKGGIGKIVQKIISFFKTLLWKLRDLMSTVNWVTGK